MQQLFVYICLLFIILIISASIKIFILNNFCFNKPLIRENFAFKLNKSKVNIKDKIEKERKKIQNKNKFKGQSKKYDKHYNIIKNEKFNNASIDKNKKHNNNTSTIQKDMDNINKDQYNISFANGKICLQYNESDILNQRISTIKCANAFKENNLFSVDQQHFISPNSDTNMCLSYTEPNVSTDPDTLRVTFMPKDDGKCISSQNSPSNNNIIKTDCVVNDEQKDCMMFSKKYLQDQNVDHNIYYTYSSNDTSLVPSEWKLV
jgi:hypothetical protein